MSFADTAAYSFPADYSSVLQRMDQIDVVRYAKSRNFLNGSVTRLSPYLTHGVISTGDILEHILKRYSLKRAEKLVFELAWRDFFQSVYRWHGEGIFSDLRQAQNPVASYALPDLINKADTGIFVLDGAIEELFETGYMHNHSRLWLASLVCNIARVHWYEPAAWLYYHLLDGDLASNTLSWQWVAGSFSNKKYYANQSNLDKYSGSKQSGTVLDTSYEMLSKLRVPDELKVEARLELNTVLPESTITEVNPRKSVLLYHLWMLSPTWQRATRNVTRVLVLEPSFLKKHPMSQKRMDFVLALCKNIPNLELFVGELDELRGLRQTPGIYTRSHPSIEHWRMPQLIKEAEKSMFNPVLKEYRSFFAYWKACQTTEIYRDSGAY